MAANEVIATARAYILPGDSCMVVDVTDLYKQRVAEDEAEAF